jgi:hypothetical protein
MSKVTWLLKTAIFSRGHNLQLHRVAAVDFIEQKLDIGRCLALSTADNPAEIKRSNVSLVLANDY